MEGKNIVEVMSGVGRHVPTYQEFKPNSITLVDLNWDNINKARKQYKGITSYA